MIDVRDFAVMKLLRITTRTGPRGARQHYVDTEILELEYRFNYRSIAHRRQRGVRRKKGTMEIEGRTAVVTGAAGGIGAALARALHERGARVLLADLAEAVAGTAAELGQSHWTGDVSTEAGVDELM